MRQRLVAIHLHGPLADRYGTPHRLAVMTPREAVMALDANYPGFLGDFAGHERYAMLVDGDLREGEAAAILPASREIHFVPMIEGNIPLIAPVIATAFGIGTLTATIISGVLVTGLLIGLSLLFAPKPPEKEAEEKDESFIFTGPENVTGQGVAVPLIYGRVFAGTVVVSAGQDVVKIPVGRSAPSLTAAAEPGEPTGADIQTTTPERGADVPASANTSKPAGIPAPAAKWTGTLTDMEVYGGGTDHLRDDVPPTGWPAIVADPVYLWRPDFWIPAGMICAVEEEDGSRKQVMDWMPDYETVDYVYHWNMVRGFYVTDVGVGQELAEWIAGDKVEIPVEDPAL